MLIVEVTARQMPASLPASGMAFGGGVTAEG